MLNNNSRVRRIEIIKMIYRHKFSNNNVENEREKEKKEKLKTGKLHLKISKLPFIKNL